MPSWKFLCVLWKRICEVALQMALIPSLYIVFLTDMKTQNHTRVWTVRLNHTESRSGMGELGTGGTFCFFFTTCLHIKYSACTPPRGWLNMWLIQHHESIELHKSQADLFKLQNQLCKTTEKVYNRCCQVGAWRRMDLPGLRCRHAPY